MKKRKSKPRNKRIYFGPPGAETKIWWDVKVTDAKQPVTVDGDVIHALKGFAGTTIGCGLSNMAMDKKNKSAFPHPVYLASFAKSAAWIVDKINRKGQPCHAVRYYHRYGHITDLNDARLLKKMVKEDPEIMTRSFTLRVPRKQEQAGTYQESQERGDGSKPRAATFVHRGAMLRAVKAGRISEPAAEQLAQVASD